MRSIRWTVWAIAPFLGLISVTVPGNAQHSQAEKQASQSVPGQRTPAPADAFVYIGAPRDGQVLKPGRIKVWFGARNIGVAPAGVTVANTGHHHLLINVPVPPLNEPIPNSKSHLHFGAGQTETYIDLPEGTYTLQLIMGDADHVPHDPPVTSKTIKIRVR